MEPVRNDASGSDVLIILGIDPGVATTGYGILSREGDRQIAIDFGVILTPAKMETPHRIQMIYERICELLDQHKPDVLVTERLFFAKNETTAFGVGRTIGVILLAAAQREIPWTEYTPPQVKQAVVGYGNAEKKQVQYMVERLLKLPAPPKPDDAADAVDPEPREPAGPHDARVPLPR